jgi:hypothetical protein
MPTCRGWCGAPPTRKVLACHSVDRRCTLKNASCAIPVMIRSDSLMIHMIARWRSTIMTAPSASMSRSATSAA